MGDPGHSIVWTKNRKYWMPDREAEVTEDRWTEPLRGFTYVVGVFESNPEGETVCVGWAVVEPDAERAEKSEP